MTQGRIGTKAGAGSPGASTGGRIGRATNWLAAALLVALALLVSCAEAPQVRFYELAPPAAAGPASKSGVRLGVERFRVDPPYDQDRIVYRIASDPNEIGFYAYHRWATPLDGMLALATARRLESRSGVALSEPVDPEATYDLVVGGRLLELDEVDGPDGEEARVEIELSLRVPRGGAGRGAGRELWRGRFRASASGHAEDVAAVVALMEKALDEALGRGTDELVRHLPSPKEPAEPATEGGPTGPSSR